MAISFIGSAEGSAANGADVTLTLPSMQQNDLVIVAYAIGDNDNVNFNMAMVTAGYTEVADLHSHDTFPQDCDLGVFWKIMGATPDTTAVVDGLGGTDAAVAAVAYVFRGVDTITPMDVTPTTATGVNSNRPNPPSIDHLNPSGILTVAVGAFSHTSGAAVTATAPTNYTGVIDASGDDTTDVTVAIARRADPADPEDPGIFTPSIADSVNNAWCACTIALRPAPPPSISADPGSYAITGSAATLVAGRILDALSGSYSISGADATLLADRLLSLDPGIYTIDGKPATILADRILNLEPGVYAIVGMLTVLELGGGAPSTEPHPVYLLINVGRLLGRV